MPTAARLDRCRFCLAMMGYAPCSRMIMPLDATSTQFGYFIPTIYRPRGLSWDGGVIGSVAGGGVSRVSPTGVTGGGRFCILGLFVQSGREDDRESDDAAFRRGR